MSTDTDRLAEFVDPITGTACRLVMRGNGLPGVEHIGCLHLAEPYPDMDAFYCNCCGHNGRVSGQQVIAFTEARRGMSTDTGTVPTRPGEAAAVEEAIYQAFEMAADWYCPKNPRLPRSECRGCVAEVAAVAAYPIIAAAVEERVRADEREKNAATIEAYYDRLYGGLRLDQDERHIVGSAKYCARLVRESGRSS